MVKHDDSCAGDIAHLAFSQEPVHQKQEEANGKNKTVEIRMDSPPPPPPPPAILIYRFASRLWKEYQWEERNEKGLKMESTSFYQIY